jgi:hypothetical protein
MNISAYSRKVEFLPREYSSETVLMPSDAVPLDTAQWNFVGSAICSLTKAQAAEIARYGHCLRRIPTVPTKG